MHRIYVSTNDKLHSVVSRIPAEQLKMAVLVYIRNHGLSLSEREIFAIIAENAIWLTPFNDKEENADGSQGSSIPTISEGPS